MYLPVVTLALALSASAVSIPKAASLQGAPLTVSSLAGQVPAAGCAVDKVEGASDGQAAEVCAEQSAPTECKNGEQVYIDAEGVERRCSTVGATLQDQSSGLGHFGYVGIALVLTGGVAAIALAGGSPASP